MKLGFVLREALAGFRRNMTMTVAMIITTAISLALLTTGFLLTDMTQRTKDIYIDKVEVMVQLNDELSTTDTDCSSEECVALKETLEGDDGVEAVTFRNKDQSYQRFVQLFGQSDPRLVEQTSPDAFPAALHVRLVDPTETGPIDAIKDNPAVGNIVDQGAEVQEATSNLDSIRNAAFLIAAVQALASIFLIMNMVQIAAFNRRSEISIMRMVGATRWFTQAPFVIEAVIGAVIGAVLSIAALLAAKTFVVDKAMASLYDANLVARITSGDIWIAAPFVVLLGAVVAAVTAQVTLRWYVKK
ncbi:ABC transporter permease [Corynebacterium sp. 319]|uniref:permease-like cell division protein FtsX n=1 Tax=unclassified Corynebacterium TaxID=2624378 RepID=UPI00125CCCBA|nr:MULTISPECIES: permease-like cell division protein FtsX [unclassified Corynebacterium]KAB1551470.1 ABC transporter permease [Corynebacterium sp. 321]KAB1551702.1 ABC transporter permease [Corynebacterium sp. 319]KAB3538692.1 ABC transporter permease [Corynebacterium sp. 366]